MGVCHLQDKGALITVIPNDPWDSWWIKATAYALFAAFGGMMGHLMRFIDSGNKISWPRAALEGCAAGFVGLIVFLVCQAMDLSEQWTGVIVGVCGWLGANATIRMLETVVTKKLGIEKDSNDVQPPQ